MSELAAILGVQAAVSALSEKVRQSTVELRAGPRQLGAGIAWGNDLVLTNAHVATHDRPEVTTARGVTRPARLLARDPARDLALLRVDHLDLAPVSLGRADRLRPGMLVFAVGHPRGVVGALSAGVVHAVGSAPGVLAVPGPARRFRWLQLDLDVAPGNSGGPVLDAAGEVVGLTTMIVAGLALAVPGEEALRWATRRLEACIRSAS
jgi:serine protease Do